MAIVIRGLGKALPLKEMKNTDFPPELGTSDEWIRSHTGIGSRRIAGSEDTSANRQWCLSIILAAVSSA